MNKNKFCLMCNKKLNPKSKAVKYCSWDCSLKYRLKLRRGDFITSKQWLLITEFIKEKYNYKCAECSNDENLQIHHIKPLCSGGNNDYNNLILLCQNCHIKSHKVISNLA